MSNWIKAANPAGRIESEAEATDAARSSSLALWLSAANALIGGGWLWLNKEPVQDAMNAAVAAASVDQAPEAAAMAGAMMQNGVGFAIGLAVILAAIQIGLGVWQWRKPGSVIPIIFLLLSAYALVTGLMGLGAVDAANPESVLMNPMWKTWLSLIVAALCTLLHVAGLRGGLKLGKLQKA